MHQPSTERRRRRDGLHLAAAWALALGLAGCGQTEASMDAVSLETARAEHECVFRRS
jgi:ABC-type uncharacterized transport system auxiliary subunit